MPQVARLTMAPVMLFAASVSLVASQLSVFLFPVMMIAAAGFALVSAALALRAIVQYWQTRRQDMIVVRMIRDDPDCGFLTDSAGLVHYANLAALARFGDCADRGLADVFGAALANPAPFLRRLTQAARNAGASKEDVITRRGHFRLNIVTLGPDRQLWRLDDLGDGPTGQGSDESCELPMFRLAADGRVAHMNNSLRNMLGRKVRKLGDLFDDVQLASGMRQVLRAAHGQVRVITTVVPAGRGMRNVYLLPDDQGDGPRLFQAGWHAIEDLPIPMLKIAPAGEILGANREARQLLQLDNSVSLYLADILDGLGRPISDWLREALEGRAGRNPQFLRGRGSRQDLSVHVTLNAAGGTRDPHLIAVLDDVTELKTLEEKFVQSQKMQAIGQLAGGVAHDFNNLLTAISGHCDLLLLRHDEGDQNYSDLIQINQNANRAASLVGQLLAFSRKQTLLPEVIDLRDSLSELTHLLNRLVGEKVSLVLQHDAGLLPIKADRRQLEQVIMNLVVNARDAMVGGGEIRIETTNLRLTEPMQRDRAIVPKGQYVCIKVSDEGHGIAPDKLQKIFEPFYSTKRPGEGTGLGLSTAYGIVKQTGGFIFVKSDLGKGAEFSMLFPSYDLPVSRPVVIARPPRDFATEPASGVVLLVEDEAPVRAFAARALRLRGYTVLEADCAEAALTMLEDPDLQVDIFVTDVIMPGLDGPTWVRKALTHRPQTKVVFVSGYAEDAFSDGESRIAGAIFLPKPFSLNALTQTVQTQLQQTVLA
jgi:two-component system, cell cycle sensor histidine kinase and response regulator CckA